MRITVAVLMMALTTSTAIGVRAQPASPSRGPAAGPRVTREPPRARLDSAQPPTRKPDAIELTDEGELAKVVSLYEAGKYAECAGALKPLLDRNRGSVSAIARWSRTRASISPRVSSVAASPNPQTSRCAPRSATTCR